MSSYGKRIIAAVAAALLISAGGVAPAGAAGELASVMGSPVWCC